MAHHRGVPRGTRPPAPGEDGLSGFRLRELTPEDDLTAFGRVVLAAYTDLPGRVPEPDYDREVVDVASRVRLATVVGAFDEDGTTPLGCITYVVGHDSVLAEHGEPGAASFRMLGVAPQAQGRGVGEALVRWCIERASADGATALALHTAHWMVGAQRLYGRLGFERAPELDWVLTEPPITLLGYRLRLPR